MNIIYVVGLILAYLFSLPEFYGLSSELTALAAIFGLPLFAIILFNPIVHEIVHYAFYELKGYRSKIRVRIKGGVRDGEIPMINPFVVTPEQLIPNRVATIGYILPLFLLTSLYIIVILLDIHPMLDIFLAFAIVQNIAGSTIDWYDFSNAVARDSETYLWMIETEDYAETFVGTRED